MLLLPTLVLALLPGSLAAPSWPSHMTEEVPATWQAEAFPGGPTLNLTGTLQQVRRQLLEINPDYDNAFANVTGDGALTVRGDDFINANTLCSISVYGRCLGRWVADQLYYLRNHAPVRPTLPAGPGKCARVSCEWKSSVWWCNDVSALCFSLSRRVTWCLCPSGAAPCSPAHVTSCCPPHRQGELTRAAGA